MITERINGLVSIIVPIHNSELFLPKCLESIRRQTYKEIELILIDDGSEDSSRTICEVFQANNPNINIIVWKNEVASGVSSARNKGLDLATGEFIAFIDSDDYIDEQFIENLVDNMKKNYTDIEIFSHCIEDENGAVIKNPKYPEKLFSLDDEYDSFAYYAHRGVWSCLFRNTVIYEYTNGNIKHLMFDEHICIGEDLLFYTEALVKAKKVHYSSNEAQYHYVVHKQGAYLSANPQKMYTAIKAHKKVVDIFEDFGLKTATRKAKEYLVYRLYDYFQVIKQYKEERKLCRNLQKEMYSMLPFVLKNVGGEFLK